VKCTKGRSRVKGREYRGWLRIKRRHGKEREKNGWLRQKWVAKREKILERAHLAKKRMNSFL
jgi:hypothetical protein